MVQHILVVRRLLKVPSKIREFSGQDRMVGLSAVDKQLPGNNLVGEPGYNNVLQSLRCPA